MNPDDLRLASILTSGTEGEVVIVGAPFDYLRRRSLGKGGEDNGPCCLRRFFGRVGPIVNPEHQISIAHLKVSDYGNIEFKEEESNQTPQRCISRISEEIISLIGNQKLPFVFGGSKESLLGCANAFQKAYPEGRHLLISGRPGLRRHEDLNQPTSDNALTFLCETSKNNPILFGAHTRYFPQNYASNFELISLSQIRKTKAEGETYTQAGTAITQLLSTIRQSVHVSLTVEAIERFRGCRQVLSAGLTVEQIIEIFMLLGASPQVKLVDISQFNPSVEDYESSLLLVNLLYYFLMGWTKRGQSQ